MPMIGRRRGASVPEGSSDDRALVVAVFHRSDNVEQHVSPLRAASGLQLELIRKGAEWTAPSDIAGMLWELTLDDGAHRLVTSLTSQTPAVSYSATSQAGLVELSRSLGFLEHLTLPLHVEQVERALGLRGLLDLADRLEAAAPRLTAFAARPDAVGGILRAVNVGTDPPSVATAIV